MNNSYIVKRSTNYSFFFYYYFIIFFPLTGCERTQMWNLWPGIYSAGQHEATCPDPHQYQSIPMPFVFQELCAKADSQSTYDCSL